MGLAANGEEESSETLQIWCDLKEKYIGCRSFAFNVASLKIVSNSKSIGKKRNLKHKKLSGADTAKNSQMFNFLFPSSLKFMPKLLAVAVSGMNTNASAVKFDSVWPCSKLRRASAMLARLIASVMTLSQRE